MELRFHTVAKLGNKRELTPEGYLICKDVPVARTGTMVYGPNETPIAPGSDGYVHIKREEEAVFDPIYMASLEGKTITDDHPEDDVNPDNVRDLFRGTMMNLRRGSGMQADLLLSDLIVMERSAIKAVNDGKVEVSLGYTADYEELGPGHGRQLNLIGNHVALVMAGRCGNRCSIGDKQFNQNEGNDMTKRAVVSADAKAKLLEAINALDSDAGGDENSGDTHVHLHTSGKANDQEASTNDAAVKALDERVGKIESKIEEGNKATADAIAALTDLIKNTNQAVANDSALSDEIKENLKDEANAGTADKAATAKDSAFLSESYQETCAAAEILMPGIRIPTYDQADNPATTMDSICKLRRNALDLAYNTADGRAIIEDVNGGKPLELTGMKCNAVRAIFRGAVAAKKIANKSVADSSMLQQQQQTTVSKGPKTLAELNELNASKWKDKMSV